MSLWSSIASPSTDALRHLIIEHPDGVLVVDRRGIVAFANPAAMRMLRPEGVALVGSEFGHPAVTADMSEIHISATGLVVEMRVSRLEWDGGPARLVALRDVTARRAAALAESGGMGLPSEAERATGLGSWEIDVPTGRVSRSPGCARLLGLSMDELTSRSDLMVEAVHPDDRGRWWEAMEDALAGKRSLDIEFRLIRPDGETRSVHSVAEPVRGPDGRPVKLRGIVRDVTEERRSVEALSASEARFRLIAEHSHDMIFLVRMSPRPVVEYMSPASRSVLGCDPDELTGDLERMLAVFDPQFRAVAEEGLRSPRPEPTVSAARRCDGSPIWIEWQLFPIRDESGRTVAIEGNIRDVTGRMLAEHEQQRLADQLEQAERLEALGRLAGGVAHDFNNLLAVILGNAELLADDIEPGDPRLADVERIALAAERGAALTRQLLIFSRREPSRLEVLDVNEVVTKIGDLLRRTIGADVELVSRLSPRLAAVHIDRSKLEQVVLNLVVNARAAMSSGGRLTLETDQVVIGDVDALPENAGEPPVPAGEVVPVGEYVRLTVTDTGSGMEPEVARRAFEPFFTTRGPGEGSGLGLATVYGVVTDAGGRITLRSRPEAGTTVEVYLPASSSVADAVVLAPDDPSQGRGETVLVVEDENEVREVVVRVLRRNNYHVLDAADPAEALRMCALPGCSIDLLLTDLIMPGMLGTDLAERLRLIHPALPVVFMSGYAADNRHSGDRRVRQPARETLGAVLTKPFDAATVLDRIRESLDAAPAGPP